MQKKERKKFGVEMLPELHHALRKKAIGLDIPFYEAMQAAVKAYLGEEQAGPQRQIPRSLRPYMDLLADVLESGDDLAIRGVTVAIDFSHRRMRPGRAAEQEPR